MCKYASDQFELVMDRLSKMMIDLEEQIDMIKCHQAIRESVHYDYEMEKDVIKVMLDNADNLMIFYDDKTRYSQNLTFKLLWSHLNMLMFRYNNLENKKDD